MRSVAVFATRRRARCSEMWAVLDAAGIAARVENRRGGWQLVVGETDRARALRELDDYRREDVRHRPEPLSAPLPGGWNGVAVYAAVLLTVNGLAGRRAFGADWVAAGSAQAGLIVQGEWWRAVTALTLHVDTDHLLGNLAFGSVLGLLASQGLGAGVAWLVILGAGAAGNLANAVLQPAHHSAVGASTAVFAALGLLVARALHHRWRRAAGPVRRWSPLIAGVLLLAWTGVGGERTDVLAHVTGLLAGLGLGAACGSIPPSALGRRSMQAPAALLAIAALVAAWLLALG